MEAGRSFTITGAVLATMLLAGGGRGDPWAERMAHLPARVVDPALPDQEFAMWLGDVLLGNLPPTSIGAAPFRPCGTGASECMELAIDIPSRARRLVLAFDRISHAFVGGSIGGPDFAGPLAFDSLADFPGILTLPARLQPLACPAATSPRAEREYAGLHEWCEDGAGVRQGPARAWFQTGVYLMHRGAYRDGLRDGPWFECDRFERCGRTRYVSGEKVPDLEGG